MWRETERGNALGLKVERETMPQDQCCRYAERASSDLRDGASNFECAPSHCRHHDCAMARRARR
eukprot:286894-Amphidinium_carterae.1